ncbi:MAG: stage II sporulation protein R [Bacillota bacterium]|nr:stage II sporulation protein R [Bacillota bacterium]
MKLLIKSISISIVLTIIFSMIPFTAKCDEISHDVFRLHILANSDSKADQDLKLKVRDNILKFARANFKGFTSKDDAIEVTEQNLPEIKKIAEKTIHDNGYDYKVTAQLTDMYFNTRIYDNITMPAGKYRALRILIGSGKGHNWWCVMFPPICIGAATQTSTLDNTLNSNEQDVVENGTKYQVKFKVVEYYYDVVSWFNSL